MSSDGAVEPCSTWDEIVLLKSAVGFGVTARPPEMKSLIQVFDTVERLEMFPESGRIPPELEHLSYREVVAKEPANKSKTFSVGTKTAL